LVQPINLESPLRLPGDQVVLQDGTIPLGRLGRMQVAGKTIEQIETEINAKIRATGLENSQVSARLVSRDSKVFYVLGEVNAPGTFPLRGRETVLDALLCAGGLSSNASRCQIILTRPTSPCSCRIVLPVDYNGIVQLGDTTTNYQIRAGDRIFVPSKSLWTDLHALFHPQRNPPVGCCEVHDAIRTTYFAPIYHTTAAEGEPVAPAPAPAQAPLPSANVPAPHPFGGSPSSPIPEHPGQPASAEQRFPPPSRKDG
ncbi:MAG: polysaccharide biosynthesis/export family protein, partial [Gemmataceae bacterium]